MSQRSAFERIVTVVASALSIAVSLLVLKKANEDAKEKKALKNG